MIQKRLSKTRKITKSRFFAFPGLPEGGRKTSEQRKTELSKSERSHRVHEQQRRSPEISAFDTKGFAVVAQESPNRVPRRGKTLLSPPHAGLVQGARRLRVHNPAEALRRRLLQGQVSTTLQPGPSPRPAAESHVEGGSKEGAASLLRAQQARRTRDTLLRRGGPEQTQDLELEGHASARVRLLLGTEQFFPSQTAHRRRFKSSL